MYNTKTNYDKMYLISNPGTTERRLVRRKHVTQSEHMSLLQVFHCFQTVRLITPTTWSIVLQKALDHGSNHIHGHIGITVRFGQMHRVN